ncbi:MAG: YggT family protein [Candidatus Sungbacteria bacterium]|uniref:YggT family protein n=1 Tax=Candidatus Sungiibacteriota bacterium TaxID=2750080 RepID=A0A931WNY9_9BACT|nr:YggT family protein [Candidatus Sungbacteria bacterium]
MNTYQIQDAAWAGYRWAYKAIRRAILVIWGLVEFVLLLRLMLVFLRANPEALVAREIYRLTRTLLFPFQSILPDYIWRDRPIELTAVAAIIGYLIAGLAVLSFLKLFHWERRTLPPPIQYR